MPRISDCTHWLVCDRCGIQATEGSPQAVGWYIWTPALNMVPLTMAENLLCYNCGVELDNWIANAN